MIIRGEYPRVQVVLLFAAAVLLGLMASGCASTVGRKVQAQIDRLPWRNQDLETAVPAVPPAPPTTPPADTSDHLQWIPGPDSVRIIIPLPHWLINVCTTTPAVNHEINLWGPSRDARREYTLTGSGESWRTQALSIDPRGGGAIVVFINTNSLQPHGYRTAHWVIPDPRKSWSGPQEWVGSR